MTELLDRAVAKARRLPAEEQDAVATLLLDEIEAEAAWERRFRDTAPVLAALAEEARSDDATGRASEGDPSDRA